MFQAFNKAPKPWPDEVESVYSFDVLKPEDDDVKLKTLQALDLVLIHGLSQFVAAQQMGISTAAVSRPLLAAKTRPSAPAATR